MIHIGISSRFNKTLEPGAIAAHNHSARFTYLTLFVAFVSRAVHPVVGARPTVLHNHSTQLSVPINTSGRV